jgi:hypothetical protein
MADNPIPLEPALTAWRAADAAVLAAKVVAAVVAMAGVAMAAADAEVVVVVAAEAATVAATAVVVRSDAKTQPIQTPACQSLRNKVLKA